jgi:hypothetical protein
MLQLTASPISSIPTNPDATTLIMERVRGEFREMPGLTLTLPQAGRLWSLDAQTCADVLAELVSTGFLCRRPDGAFCRATQMN